MRKKHFIWSFSTTLLILLTVLIVMIKPKENIENIKSSDDDHQNKSKAIFTEDNISEVHIHSGQEKDDGIMMERNLQGKWEIPHAEENISELKVEQTFAMIQAITSQLNKSIDINQSEVKSQAMKSNRMIILVNESGDKQTLNIGGTNNDGTIYYLIFSSNKKIYPVSAQLIDQLPTSKDDLYDRKIVRVTPDKLTKIVIRNRLHTVELLPYSPYSEEEVRANLSGWFMHQPYKHVYSVKYQQMEDMIYGVNHLEWTKVISETGGKLEEYGLLDPAFEITLYSEENEETILVGAPATSQTYYAMLKDDQRVYTIHSNALHPYSYQAFDMIDKFVKIIAIDVLKDLFIETTEEQIHIEVIGNKNTGEEEFLINKQQVMEQNFRDLYKVIAGLSVSKEVTDAVYQTPEATMRYIIIDQDTEEKEIKVEFVSYNDESYAIFIDHEADFIIKQADFIDMLEQIHQVFSNET